MKSPTLYDLDLSSARQISYHRYVRNDAPIPEGWADDGPCPGHHGNWSRMATKEHEMALTPDQMEAVNRPAHYTQGGVEVIDIIEQIIAGYKDPVVAGLVWQVLKYLARAPHKGNLQQDLGKAEWYMKRAVNKSVRL
jgi:hypothetical protein